MIRITFKLLLINFLNFFEICNFKILVVFFCCLQFFLIFFKKSIFFATTITKLGKFKTKNIACNWRGGINPIIWTKNVTNFFFKNF